MADRVKGFEARRGGKAFAHQLRMQSALSTVDKTAAQDLVDRFRRGLPQHGADVEQAQSRMHRIGRGPREITYIGFDEASHIDDALVYGRMGAKMTGAVKALSEHSDAALIMELLSRGYACMKCPEPGMPPEVLRNG
jgi:hypothetical protein